MPLAPRKVLLAALSPVRLPVSSTLLNAHPVLLVAPVVEAEAVVVEAAVELFQLHQQTRCSAAKRIREAP